MLREESVICTCCFAAASSRNLASVNRITGWRYSIGILQEQSRSFTGYCLPWFHHFSEFARGSFPFYSASERLNWCRSGSKVVALSTWCSLRDSRRLILCLVSSKTALLNLFIFIPQRRRYSLRLLSVHSEMCLKYMLLVETTRPIFTVGETLVVMSADSAWSLLGSFWRACCRLCARGNCLLCASGNLHFEQ